MSRTAEAPAATAPAVPAGASRLVEAVRRDWTALIPAVLAFLAGMLGPLLGFANGGFDVSTSAPLAALSLIAIGIVVALAPVAVPRSSPALLAIAALTGLAALTAASLAWSPMVDLGWAMATKGIAYAALFALAGVVIRTSRAALAALAGVATGAAILALASVYQVAAAEDPTGWFWNGRLAGPVGYQNAFALIMAAGAIAAMAVTMMSARGPVQVARRAGAYLVIGLTVSAGVASQSRGAALGAAVGLAALAALAPRRARLVPAVAAAAVAAAITFGPAVDLREGVIAGPAAASAAVGDWAPRAWLAVALVTALGLAHGALEATVGRRRSVRAWARRAALGSAGAVALAGAIVLALNASTIAERASEPLATGVGAETRTGERFVSISPNERTALWDRASDALADRPLLGQGAGGFAIWWNMERGDIPTDTLFAHSVFLEVGSETGLLGLALLAVWLAALTWMLVRVLVRRRVRRLPVAALAAVVLAWLAGAAFDWHWQTPAVTIPAIVAAGALIGLGGAGRRPAGAGWRPATRVGIAAAAVLVAVGGVVFVGRPFLADRHVAAAADIGITDPAAARELLDRAEGLNRWDPRIDELRARISLGEGELRRARRELVEGTRRVPELYLTWRRLADFDENVREDPRRARAAARRALALHSGDSGIRDQIRRLERRIEEGRT